MEKEMMAKVNEVLKAHGRRELSLDELEQVSGGNKYLGPYEMNNLEDVCAFVDLMDSMEQACNRYVVAQFLEELLHSETLTQSYLRDGNSGVYNFLVQHFIENPDQKY